MFDFDQNDLDNDDVMLLDTYVEVFLWVGSDARADEKKAAMKLAVDYVTQATDGRDSDCPILMVAPGKEPIMFTCHFHGWDYSLAYVCSCVVGAITRCGC